MKIFKKDDLIVGVSFELLTPIMCLSNSGKGAEVKVDNIFTAGPFTITQVHRGLLHVKVMYGNQEWNTILSINLVLERQKVN